MIGNTFLVPRVEPRALGGVDGLDGYARREFQGLTADALVAETFAPRAPEVHLDGGRGGWVAKARRAVTMAVAFLLPPISRRALAGRGAPNFVPATDSISGSTCGDATNP